MRKILQRVPHFISLFRALLAIFVALAVLEKPYDKNLLMVSFGVTICIISLDGIDGLLARRLNVASSFGKFLDTACDRIVELIYIALFVMLKWIPFLIFVIFLVRGIFVDGWDCSDHFLKNSRLMRGFYGLVKGFAFGGMFLAQSVFSQILNLEMFLIYFMTFICILRAIPPLIKKRKGDEKKFIS